MARRPFKDKVTQVDQPSRAAKLITPNDSVNLLTPRALYVGDQGDVSVIMADDDTDTPITFAGMIGFNPIMVKRVLSTGTDADNIIALY